MPVRRGRTRARRGEGARLREEIVETAARLVGEDGHSHAVSIRALAETIGVTPPALYLHFQDKDEILAAAAARRFEELERDLDDLLSTDDDELEILSSAARSYVRFGTQHRGLYEILAHATADGPGSRPPAFGQLARAVRRCVESGVLEGDAERLAALLWAALHGLVLATGRLAHLNDAAAERFLDVQIEGLLSV